MAAMASSGKDGAPPAAADVVVANLSNAEDVRGLAEMAQKLSLEGAKAAEHPARGQQSFRLDILELVKQAQSQHGLRHNDYMRYRQYCSRKLRRIRKSLSFTHGKKEFRQRALDARKVTELRHLHIPLYNAERAWSYAMQLRQAITEDEPRPHFHMLRRLRKAAKWSKQLVALCADLCDPRTQLEAEAYSALMEANLLFSEEDWQRALQQFQTARNVYAQLGRVSPPSQQALYQEKLTQIEPNIRYCKFVLSRAAGASGSEDSDMLLEMESGADEVLQSKIEAVLAEARQHQAESVSSVTWQGQSIPISNERVRVCIIDAEQHVAQLSQCKEEQDLSKLLELYNIVFTKYDDVLQLVRKDLQDAERAKKATVDNLTLLRDYLTFSKLRHMNERNLYMIDDLARGLEQQETGQRSSKKVKPDDLVHLLDKMGASVDTLHEAGRSQLDPNLRARLDAEGQGLLALRCYYLAESYFALDRFPEAYVLFTRTAERIRQAVESLKSHSSTMLAGTGTFGTDLLQRLTQLAAKVPARKHAAHAQALLLQLGEVPLTDSKPRAHAKSKEVKAEEAKGDAAEGELESEDQDEDIPPLLERLDRFESGDAARAHQIVALPPTYVPVTGKPILFDVAFNAVQYPDVSHRFSRKQQQKKPPPSQQQQQQPPSQQQQQQQQQQASLGGWISGLFKRG